MALANAEFAKQNNGKGIDLQEVFREFAEGLKDEEFSQAMGEAVAEILKTAHIVELADAYPFRITTCERTYYPIQGTLRMVPTGQILFQIVSYESAFPVYMTLENDAIEAIEWHKVEAAQAEESALRVA